MTEVEINILPFVKIILFTILFFSIVSNEIDLISRLVAFVVIFMICESYPYSAHKDEA